MAINSNTPMTKEEARKMLAKVKAKPQAFYHLREFDLLRLLHTVIGKTKPDPKKLHWRKDPFGYWYYEDATGGYGHIFVTNDQKYGACYEDYKTCMTLKEAKAFVEADVRKVLRQRKK